MDDNSFSVVLISWGRRRNLPAILANVLDRPYVDDVVLIHQGVPAIGPDMLGLAPPDLRRVLLRNQAENHFTWSRFAACRCCKHDRILTCDDDTLVQNWDEIAESFTNQPEAITAALSDGHFVQDYRCHWKTAHEVLLGWGSAFDRRWIGPTFEPYIAEFGHDTLLDRKADRIFSILLNRKHNVLPAKYREMPGTMDADIALYRRTDHEDLTKQARARALKLLKINAK
jgi:hypothetical protein